MDENSMQLYIDKLMGPFVNQGITEEMVTNEIDRIMVNNGRSPEEIAMFAVHKMQVINMMNGMLVRTNIPLEEILVSAEEFIYYKLASEQKICVDISLWKRQDKQFLIKYKTPKPIEFNDENKIIVIDLVKKLHTIGIIHLNLNKNTIVRDIYNNIRLIDFSCALWINDVDFLDNNPYYNNCKSVDELLALELQTIDEIFDNKK
jgi:hypothetical protein